jgi:hypothetical protein
MIYHFDELQLLIAKLLFLMFISMIIMQSFASIKQMQLPENAAQ